MGVGFIIISRQAGLVLACKNRCEKKVRLIDIHKYYIPDAARTDLNDARKCRMCFLRRYLCIWRLMVFVTLRFIFQEISNMEMEVLSEGTAHRLHEVRTGKKSS